MTAVCFPTQGHVTARNVNVRTAATTRSTVLKRVQKGQRLDILGYADGFYRVKTPGGEGTAFISADYVNGVAFDAPIEAFIDGKVYAQTRMNTSPRYRAATFANGDTVEIIGRETKWWKVRIDGETGYIMNSRYIHP